MAVQKKRYLDYFILIFLIILNIFDFFKQLPGDIDFLKKIISWLLLGYLLYRTSLVKQIFGGENKALDAALIIGYFMLILKNLFSFMMLAREETAVFYNFFGYVLENHVFIQYLSFYIGAGIVVLISLYLTFNVRIKRPSLMHVLHGKRPKGFLKKAEFFFSLLLIFSGFFILIFNLMMEWLAIAVDASLLVFTIIFYILTLFGHHSRKLKASHFLYKVTESAEDFYSAFIRLFHTKKRIYLGISGLLVLHLLTDVGIFIVPYVFGLRDILYFGQLGSGHLPLYRHLVKDLALGMFYSKAAVVLVYLFNVLAILFLLVSPAYIWFKLYKRCGFKLNRLWVSLFFSSVLVFLLAPSFRIRSIKLSYSTLAGVDILTQSIFTNAFISAVQIVILALLVGFLIYFFSYRHWFKEIMIAAFIVLVDLFVFRYIYIFAKDVLITYIDSMVFLFFSPHFFILLFFALFFVIELFFYVIGFVIFLLETKKEFKYIR